MLEPHCDRVDARKYGRVRLLRCWTSDRSATKTGAPAWLAKMLRLTTSGIVSPTPCDIVLKAAEAQYLECIQMEAVFSTSNNEPYHASIALTQLRRA